MDTDTEIRNAMRAELERRGWPQQRMADEMGVSKSSLSQLLSGDYSKVPPSLLKALDTLGLKLAVVPKYDPPYTQARILPRPAHLKLTNLQDGRGWEVQGPGVSFKLIHPSSAQERDRLASIGAHGYRWTMNGLELCSPLHATLVRVEVVGAPGGYVMDFDTVAQEAAHQLLQRPLDPSGGCL